MDIKLPDLTKLHWQLNVAIVAAIFSIFSLVYNDKFIYFGFATFVYGVLGTSILPALEHYHPESKYRNYFIVQSILSISWIIICLCIYFLIINPK